MKETKKLFSILIANYNNGIFFEDCYKSIINQTYPEWEVIIVDDFSDDDSLELIKGIVDEDKRFLIYRNDKNYGCGYTKKKCLDLANGEICGFFDPFDALLPEALDIMIKSHINHLDVSLIYSNYFACINSFEKKKVVKNHSIPSEFNYLTGCFKYRIGHFATFKKVYYDKSEGINPYLKRAVDQDLYLKCEEVGKVFYIDRTLYLYRIHKKGISNYNNNLKAIAWHIFVILKTCERRNIEFENILSNTFLNLFYTNDEYKLGKWLLQYFPGKVINKLLKLLHFLN